MSIPISLDLRKSLALTLDTAPTVWNSLPSVLKDVLIVYQFQKCIYTLSNKDVVSLWKHQRTGVHVACGFILCFYFVYSCCTNGMISVQCSDIKIVTYYDRIWIFVEDGTFTPTKLTKKLLKCVIAGNTVIKSV